MPNTTNVRLLCGLLALVFACQSGCAIPRHIWKQDDIVAGAINEPSSSDRVFIASGESEFKRAVIEHLEDRLTPQGVYIKFAGLSALEKVRADDYDAVVIMTSCVAWGIDPRAAGFLKRHEGANNIIVLATSGAGDWLPDTKGKGYDAVASASKQTRVEEVADEIGTKVEALLGAD
jgi:hypothetical protein